MLDFVRIGLEAKKKVIGVYPKFYICKSKDLMVRGGDFYAIWDDKKKLWSTDEQEALRLIDESVKEAFEAKKDDFDNPVEFMSIIDSSNGLIDKWHKFVQKQMRDNYKPLDRTIIFSDDETDRQSYASRKLSYPLKEGSTENWDKLMSVLYSPEERRKIEWAIGAIVTGDSKTVQKFLVMYGDTGTGKSTVMNIIQGMFPGYYSTFNSKALGSNGSFPLESLKDNPLIGIQHDGDLSRIEDNTILNSVVSHELLTVNEKYRPIYSTKFDTFLIMGTNRPVKITDSKSGILRRLINVSPTGDKLSPSVYRTTMKKIEFEYGAIAYHCKKVYEEDPEYYKDYIPTEMIGESNDFYNFVFDSYDSFAAADYVTLKQAWEMYKVYCDEAKVLYPYSMRVFKNELKVYFKDYEERLFIDGTPFRKVYTGFKKEKFEYQSGTSAKNEDSKDYIFLKKQKSKFDELAKDYKAQYATSDEKPIAKWESVETVLSDIDTSKLHYVRVPKNHIVIDFDIKDENGEKSFEKNLEAASKFPLTYAETSKSGKGIHLHYIYDGDVTKLQRLYAKDIEIKVFQGKSSLRRKLTKCNDQPIRTISSGLPLKEETNVINKEVVENEKHLRSLIKKNLKKEIHPDTSSSVNYIYKLLDDAYSSGLKYDVTDMRPSIISFAARSTNQSDRCLKLVAKMQFKSDDPSPGNENYIHDKLCFYDVEVFKNLFVVVYKFEGEDPVKLINPTSQQIEDLLKYKLVGFNCRRYDNHILYARLIGYTNEQLYELSQRIINGSKNTFFGEAYNLSYTDVYDFCSTKQSLKKWEIELDIHHQELGLPWDQPVDESLWETVADYCVNDVVATEAVFNARHEDFVAREILAAITGLTVNDTTNTCTTKLIVGSDKNPQSKFIYTDLSKTFPGYIYDHGVSTYMGEEVGEGGYVYSEPGMYSNVALLDIASMHPSSAIALNVFGPYTQNFEELVRARIYIKHGEYEKAGELFGGKLKSYLEDKDQAKALAYALKIAINSVYGLTAAKFENKLRDPRNIDNIVAKRGALFMVNLKHEVQERGFTVAHIKTDSIKIPDATPEIISFVMEYGNKYGYNFEHEATYEKMCLVNDAVYIAKYQTAEKAEEQYHYIPDDCKKHGGEWTATGTQFQVPYVFKSLFSKEQIEFRDLCETKTVTSALYLDMNEGLKENEHDYVFIGKAGSFCPIKKGKGGGILLREKDGKYNAATGSKGYRWLEAETVRKEHKEADIDRGYYENLCDEAIASISEYGDFEWFAER